MGWRPRKARYGRGSREVEPARTTNVIDLHKVLQKLLHDSFRVVLAVANVFRICQSEDREAVWCTLVPNRGLQRIWAIVVPVGGNQAQLTLLAQPPDDCVRVFLCQPHIGESLDRQSQAGPHIAPVGALQNGLQQFDLSLDVNVRQNSAHRRPPGRVAGFRRTEEHTWRGWPPTWA